MKRILSLALCVLLALCAVSLLAFAEPSSPTSDNESEDESLTTDISETDTEEQALDGQDETESAEEATESEEDVYTKVKEMEQNPIIHEMVDKYAPDPQQWWDWYETLPLQHESSVSKEYALTWVEIVSRLSDDERDNMNYNLFQFAAALEKYDTETTMMYSFDDMSTDSYAVEPPLDNDKFLPTGGYEHEYDEANWGGSVMEKANCYAYALNTYAWKYFPGYQPGYYGYGEYKSADFIGHNIILVLQKDAPYFNNKKIVTTTATKVPGYRQYKIAMALSYDYDKETYYDFHFYRQDKGGFWSHKRGWDLPISNRDASLNKIVDPKACDRHYNKESSSPLYNYSKFSGYFMVTY